MTALVSTDLTTVAVDGTGIFDKLMQVTVLHLHEEFKKGRIRGPEYSTVYLSALQSSLSQGIAFLVQSEQVALIRAQAANAITEGTNLTKQGLLLDAQTAQVVQATTNLVCEELKCQKEILLLAAELLNIPKQGVVLDKQALDVVASTALKTQQTANAVIESTLLIAQELGVDAATAKTTQETSNLVIAATVLTAQELKIDVDILETTQRTANLVIEGTVLTAQECKLRAEFDVLVLQKTKITAEAGLLNQKTATESAQTGGSISAGSVLGKQNLLYDAQIAGFERDAEQKAASIMLDAFNVEQAIDGLQSRDAAGVGNTDIATVLARLVAGS
jgi:hypothetical protein